LHAELRHARGLTPVLSVEETIILLGEPFRAFWEHASKQYIDPLLGNPMVLIPIRVSLRILPDTSCNERGFSEYNRIRNATQSNLEVNKVRNLFAIKYYGPKRACPKKCMKGGKYRHGN
jgi:hypothetical protein